MSITFGDVKDWDSTVYCVCTALSAVTGTHPNEVARQIAVEAQKGGHATSVNPGQGFNINHWSRVVIAHGGEMKEVLSLEHLPYQMRPTISEFIKNPSLKGVHLVFGENENHTETHVFAYSDGQLVDTYTLGKMISADSKEVPQAYDNFHIKRVFKL